MKILLLAICLLSASAKAQKLTVYKLPLYGSKDSVLFRDLPWIPDTIPVVRNISNETRPTWWRKIDNRPFPCKLMEIREYNKPIRYLKKLRHGWEPIPSYYKVWNN